MKTKHITFSMAYVAIGLLWSGIIGCSDSLNAPNIDESSYQTPTEQLAFITDKYGASEHDSLLFNEKGATTFYVNMIEAPKTAQNFTLSYDAQVLDKYNTAHGTAYQALPENLVTVDETITVEAGKMKSEPINVQYSSDASLEKNGVYAIPLRLKGNASAVSKDKGEFVLLVRDITKMPNCHKDNGLQVISCMEINDANPLYNLCFTLESSGKYFFDQVILFSGNINYNLETQEVYNYNNENITHVLQYKEKYLEPLQQKGMKVILGILGNHDRAAVTNLSDKACKLFANELKAKVEAYNLDGVFFDDEYSKPGNYPGFVSGNNASRLCYECKKAMPDKLVQVYVYSGTGSLRAVDGHQPGEFIDYGIHDYGGTSDLSYNYPGLSKKGMILGSIECARGYSSAESVYMRIKNEGYGGTMFFALAPNRTPMSSINRVAQAFYGERVVQKGTYSKDW